MMAAPSPRFEPLYQATLQNGSEVVIAQDIPIGVANVAFASTDENGSPGALNLYVVSELSGGTPKIDSSALSKTGFEGQVIAGTLVWFVVTVSSSGDTAQLLRQSFKGALAANLSVDVIRHPGWATPHQRGEVNVPPAKNGAANDRAIWVPLMGTGIGGLPHDVSLDITLHAILQTGDEGPNCSYLVSLPPGLDPGDVEALVSAADRVLKSAAFQGSNVSEDGTTTGSAAQRPVPPNSGAELDGSDAPSPDPTPFPPPRRFDATKFVHDLPSETDTLGRQAIAESIARNVLEVWPDYRKRKKPYIVHLSGRWGSGKSSLLNLLRKELPKRDWLVIDYNAWRRQDEKEAWWSLLRGLTRGAVDGLGPVWSQDLRRSDRWWRLRTTLGGAFIGFCVVFAVLAGIYVLGSFDVFPGSSPNAGQGDDSSNPFEAVAAIGGVLASLVAFASLIGSYFRRRNHMAEEMSRLSVDATNRLRARYEKVVNWHLGIQAKKNVAFFIDDLDRCDAAFVVQLLQAIQNIFSEVPVLYVVAGDRDWIKASYEHVYSDFGDGVHLPGKSLGDLFVEKIFQLSVNVPDLGTSDKGSYLRDLLRAKPEAEDLTEEQEQAAIEIVSSAEGRLEIIQERMLSEENPRMAQRIGQEAFKLITSSKSVAFFLEELLPYSNLMDPNPRAIKRLVNLYSYRYGYGYLMRMPVAEFAPKLARWCILEDRFPSATRRLLEQPMLVDWVKGTDLTTKPDVEQDFPDTDKIAEILGDITSDTIDMLRRFG